MGRILAFDFGLKRIGLAVTDPLKIIANSLITVQTTEIWMYLESYLSKETVDCFVIGYPRQMNHTPSEVVEYVDKFIEKLKKQYPLIPIELVDERFTSKMAFQAMIDSGIGKKRRQDKALVDKISATIILQSYLEGKQNIRNK